ncbi:hypothetical protein M595_4559 [Lyngbya aestuarii BL J]|uniref:Uncharacterized protein n=1 Tax=Lyngbya aestuarii BL J TaxID=1348334 RepID=U7QGC2_9CYAN|nr:hypothetical protein [Lyngbya aestuarii]ERT05471.1 hypothetical protein M595_4559 [Lyngbya aestuarii BL J]
MKITPSTTLENHAKQLLSPFILFCLILQAATAVRLLCLGSIFSFLPAAVNVGCDPALYPFISYAMYSRAKYEGQTARKRSFMAKLTDGTEVSVDHKSLGMTDYNFKKYTAKLGKDEQTLSELLQLYEALNGNKIQELFIHVETYKITKDGIVKTNFESVEIISSNKK